jgi:hypothetical protein
VKLWASPLDIAVCLSFWKYLFCRNVLLRVWMVEHLEMWWSAMLILWARITLNS